MDAATQRVSDEIGALLAAHKFEEAIARSDRALAEAPAAPFIWLQKGQAELNLGRFDAALDSLTRAARLPTDTPGLHPCILRYQADALVALEREEEAVPLYRESVAQTHVAQRGAWLGLGLALLTLGRVAEARAAVAESARLGRPVEHLLALNLERLIGSPAVGGVLFRNRGWVNYQAGAHAAAIRNLTKAIALDALDAVAYYYRGSARHANGDLLEAIADLSTAIDLEPDARKLGDRAAVRFDKGDFAGAVADATHALDLEPRDVVAHLNRAAARTRLGQLDAAIGDFTAALDIAPGNADAFRGRGFAYMEQGAFDRAIDDFTRALAARPGWADAYANRGRARRLRGDHQAAVADLEAAMTINPRLDDPYVDRAAARLETGDVEGAMHDCRTALWLNPRRADAADIFSRASAQAARSGQHAEEP